MHFLGKLRQAGALIAAGAILAGCTINIGGGETIPDGSSTGGVPSADAAADDTDLAAVATAPEAEPVIPPLGEFDRRDPNYVQYKPCLEIPDDFLVEARLFDKEMSEGVGESDGICTFSAEPEHGQAIFKLQGSRHSFATYRQISGDITWDETSFDVPILVHRGNALSDSACQAAVETERGTFGVTFQSFEYGNKKYAFDPCIEAQNKLKAVLELDGKHEN